MNNKVIIGVGAAFRFSIGEYTETNGLIKEMGLTGLIWREWSFNLFLKYIRAIFVLIKIILSVCWRRMIGEKYYE